MKNNNKISVIIPCYPPDLPEIAKALTSLAQSSYLPDEVIVALSQTTAKQGSLLAEKYQKKHTFPVKFATTVKKQFAGQNRNRGVKKARYNILVFFDADDLCHPQKLEITKYIFDKYQPKMFLHHFHEGLGKFTKYNLDKLELRFTDDIFKYTFGRPPKRKNASFIFTNQPSVPYWVGTGQPHHGHGAFDKSVFKKIKYTNLRRGQDLRFCLDVLWKFKSCVYAEADLICYIHTNYIH